MTPTAELRHALLRAESELDRHDRALRLANDSVAAIQAKFDRLVPAEGPFADRCRAQLDMFQNPNTGRLIGLTAARDQAAATVDALRTQLSAAVAAEPPIWLGARPMPAVLVPMRLEVRYMTGAEGPGLAIRVIPDDIAVHSFEPELTAAEVAAGSRYWTAASAPGAGSEQLAAAWATILRDLGAARAAWTVETMRPTGPPVDGVLPLPDVPTKDRAWTKPATSLLLPERFVFRGWRGGRLVFEATGLDIPDAVALGPDPAALQGDRPETPEGEPPMPWTGASEWMINFDRAVETGMGIRIPLSGTDVSFDEIFVVGVSDRQPLDVRTRLAETMRGHLYTHGLAFPAADAPTNNTPATRSDWTTAPTMRTPAEVEAALAAEAQDRGQPGVQVANLLGLPTTASRAAGRRDLLVAPGATVDGDELLTRRAHDLLIAYTSGFSRLDGAPPGTEAEDGWVTTRALRRHFVDLVRTRGPIATMRVGRQPYGLLPVTSLALWAPLPPAAEPPPPDEPNDELDPLHHNPPPPGPEFDPVPDPLHVFADVPAEAIGLLRLLRAAIARQLPSSPRIGRERDQDAVLVDLLHRLPESVGVRQGFVGRRPVDAPGAHGVAGERPPLDWSSFQSCTYAPEGAPSLLGPEFADVLATTVTLIEAAEEVANAWSPPAPEPEFPEQGQQLLDLLGPITTVEFTAAGLFWSLALPPVFFGSLLTWGVARDRRKAEVAGDAAAQQRLDITFKRLKAAFVALRDMVPDVVRDQGVVDRALGRAVEATTSRIDAWATSVASARLRTVQNVSSSLHLGAYGWLVDVTPTAPGIRKAQAGWVLTPSMQHAATAAVLHSGWAAHGDPAAFAVDLTSRRVRRAMATLAAIREGRTLEELLGYQLERDLHDAQLDRFVAGFRASYPLPTVSVADADPATSEAARRKLAERLVADGDAVRRAGLEDVTAKVLGGATADEQLGVFTILAGLEETVDSMGDLLLAEGVHQLIGGSPLRAGLAADTVGRAAPVPDRLDVVRTPRRAVSVNHAVGLAVTPASGGWASTPRARLDPIAEAIAAWALGAPEEWTVTATPADGGPPPPPMTLASAAVAAIDVVVETDGGEVTPFARRLRRRSGLAGQVTIRRTDGLGGDAALPAVTQAVRALLATARPVGASSAVLDAFGSGGSPADLAELAARVGTWWAQVQAAFGAWPDGTADAQQAAIATLADLGLAGIDVDSPVEAGALARERWSTFVLPAAPTPTAGSPEAAAWLARLRADLGSAAGGWVLAAPAWTAPDASWDALGGSDGPAVAPDAVDDWLRDHRDACAGVTQLLDALAATGACGAGPVDWLLRQHRPAPDGTALPPGWVAVDHPGPRSATHLAALQIGAPAPGPRALVVLDEWMETLPLQPASSTAVPVESAALAFRFDRPDARAPHAVLIAVPPDLRRQWCMEDLHASIEETLWWARARPLDADDLSELLWVLA